MFTNYPNLEGNLNYPLLEGNSRYCKSPNRRQGASWEEGFAALNLDAVYHPTTLGATLFPHSPSAIYIHVRSAGITLT